MCASIHSLVMHIMLIVRYFSEYKRDVHSHNKLPRADNGAERTHRRHILLHHGLVRSSGLLRHLLRPPDQRKAPIIRSVLFLIDREPVINVNGNLRRDFIDTTR